MAYYIEIADALRAGVPALDGPHAKIGDARRAVRAWPPHRASQATRRIAYQKPDGTMHWRQWRSRGAKTKETR